MTGSTIETACRDLLAPADTDDPRALAARFDTLERIVNDHLATVEFAILPDYQTYAPGDARAIRHEHAMIRKLLGAIRADVRFETLVYLVEILRAHVAHEDGGMYEWVRGREGAAS